MTEADTSMMMVSIIGLYLFVVFQKKSFGNHGPAVAQDVDDQSEHEQLNLQQLLPACQSILGHPWECLSVRSEVKGLLLKCCECFKTPMHLLEHILHPLIAIKMQVWVKLHLKTTSIIYTIYS